MMHKYIKGVRCRGCQTCVLECEAESNNNDYGIEWQWNLTSIVSQGFTLNLSFGMNQMG